jgi:hypothetical protein
VLCCLWVPVGGATGVQDDDSRLSQASDHSTRRPVPDTSKNSSVFFQGKKKKRKSHGSNPRATVAKMDSVGKEEMLRGTGLWGWSQTSLVLVATGLSGCLVVWASVSGVCDFQWHSHHAGACDCL